MKFQIFATVLIGLCGASPLAATEPAKAPAAAPVPAPSPEAIAAAQRLLDAMDYDHMMIRMMDAMVAQLGPATKSALESQVGEGVDDELLARIGKVQEKYLRSQILGDTKLRSAIALLYARHFTVADLDRLAILQGDPVMKRFNDAVPALMADMMPLLTGMASSDREAMTNELKQVVQDYLEEKEGKEEGKS